MLWPRTLKEGGPMPPEIIKGLKDVYFDTTESSFIDGIEGKLLYRGYNIHDLAEKSTFEEVVYLLLYGGLPNTKELADFDALLRASRIVPDDVINTIDLVELENEKSKNIICGSFYRHPNSDIATFDNYVSKCLTKISKENKNCYLLEIFCSTFCVCRTESVGQFF